MARVSYRQAGSSLSLATLLHHNLVGPLFLFERGEDNCKIPSDDLWQHLPGHSVSATAGYPPKLIKGLPPSKIYLDELEVLGQSQDSSLLNTKCTDPEPDL